MLKVSRDKFYQVMVWEEVHLNKLVPVYLYRMKEEPDDSFLRSFVGTAEITHFPRLMAAVFELVGVALMWGCVSNLRGVSQI